MAGRNATETIYLD